MSEKWTPPEWHKEFAPLFAPGWGAYLSVGDGWKDLLLKLKHDLEATGVKYHICQVKEKFGGLRFYVDIIEPAPEAKTDEFHHLISKAENDSFTICESCGEPGKQRGGGWIVTACDKCFKKE